MRSFDRMGSRYLDWGLLGAGVASLLAALALMRSGSDEPYAYGGPPFAWGLTDPVAVLSASLFLLGWLLLWIGSRFIGCIGRRVLLGSAVYVVVGIWVRGATPYTPFWSPPGLRRDVLDRLAGWLSWPQYLSGAPVSGFGAAEVVMLLLVGVVAAWVLGRRRLSSA